MFSKGDQIKVTGRVKLSDRDKMISYNGGTGREVEIISDDDSTLFVRAVDWKQKYRDGDRVQVSGTARYIREWGADNQTVYLDNQRLKAAPAAPASTTKAAPASTTKAAPASTDGAPYEPLPF